MKIYLVGGAVRDMILNTKPKDYDFVVVGATVQQMLDLGYEQVGKDFPVFLHPVTRHEYALARTERKTGNGHTDFECVTDNVTLEEDLKRRDLTINAMAFPVDVDENGVFTITGSVIDPFGGIHDLKWTKFIRPVSVHFKEDPLRVLRAARFLTKSVTYETTFILQEYCNQIFIQGDLKHLTSERVFGELSKALSNMHPSRYFEFLKLYGIHTEVDMLWGIPQKAEHHPEIDTFVHTMLVIDYAARTFKDPEITFACLLHDVGKAPCYKEYGNAYGHEEKGVALVESFCDRLKVPNSYRELAILVCKYHTKIHGCMGRGANSKMKPQTMIRLFEETKALNKPERFAKIVKSCIADARGRGADRLQQNEFVNKAYPQAEYITGCLNAAINTDTRSISKKLLERGVDGITIGKEIRAARINSIRQFMKGYFENER